VCPWWPYGAATRETPLVDRRLAEPPRHALTPHRDVSLVDRAGIETVVRALADADGG
jgi:hypothetical protein